MVIITSACRWTAHREARGNQSVTVWPRDWRRARLAFLRMGSALDQLGLGTAADVLHKLVKAFGGVQLLRALHSIKEHAEMPAEAIKRRELVVQFHADRAAAFGDRVRRLGHRAALLRR